MLDKKYLLILLNKKIMLPPQNILLFNIIF